MKRLLLVIATLLSLTVLLAACKKSDDTSSAATNPGSTPAQVEATPAPTELPPYEANVLTGEPKGADYPEGQRITSVMDADMILVLDDGHVVGQGTHAQLMESCEIYREVYESQQEGVSIDG